jgi:hypothetical protein
MDVTLIMRMPTAAAEVCKELVRFLLDSDLISMKETGHFYVHSSENDRRTRVYGPLVGPRFLTKIKKGILEERQNTSLNHGFEFGTGKEASGVLFDRQLENEENGPARTS